MTTPVNNPFLLATNDPVEASLLDMRAKLMIALRDHLKNQAGNEEALRTKLKISQPRYSNLVNGHIDLFSLDMLIKFCLRLDLPVTLSVGDTSPSH